MFLQSVSRLPDYPTLKNDSHEAWKCSVTRKKYFERPHTAVFRRQRLGTTPSTQIFKQDDRFGAKRRRLLLWSVREHLIRVVQRSAFVSTDKLWLSRLSFFGMDYSAKKKPPLVVYVNLGLSLRIERHEKIEQDEKRWVWSAVLTVYSIFSTAIFTQHCCYYYLIMIHYLISSLLFISFTCIHVKNSVLTTTSLVIKFLWAWL